MISLMDLERLKYPIGTFSFSKQKNESRINEWISDIEYLPKRIENLVKDLSTEELNFAYRPKGWKIKQVIHHLADSHMNAFIRFKLSLTEDSPTIKPYDEVKWAELEDGTSDDINDSLQLLNGIHSKWVKLLKTFKDDDFQRVYVHPEHNKPFELIEALAMYAWHSNHHLAHVKQALNFKGNF